MGPVNADCASMLGVAKISMGNFEPMVLQERLVSATKNRFSCATRTGPIREVSSVNEFDGDLENKENMEESFDGSLRAKAQLKSSGLSAINCGQRVGRRGWSTIGEIVHERSSPISFDSRI